MSTVRSLQHHAMLPTLCYYTFFFFMDVPRIAQFLLTFAVIFGISGYLLLRKRKQTNEGIDTSNPRDTKGSIFSKASDSTTPVLESYSRDLTRQASLGKLDPVIGRDTEIMRVIQILSRRRKNNPLLLGEPGVGKTAIAEGLANEIIAGKVPSTLQNKRVLALDVTGLISGTKYRGEFEKRLKRITEELAAADRSIILFIDEIHTIVQSQGSEGAINPADIFKPALARGELQAIGATTEAEYREFIKPEQALERRFQPVYIGEPSVEDTIRILKGLKSVYEKHHRVRIHDDALEAAARLSEEYIHDRFLPDKAIDVIDEASAMVKLESVAEQAAKAKEAAAKAREFTHASLEGFGDDPETVMHPEASTVEHIQLKNTELEDAPQRLRELRATLANMKLEEPKIFDPKVLKKHYAAMIEVQEEIATIESSIRELEAQHVWPDVHAQHIESIVKEWADDEEAARS